ncbi:MAG: alpha/beta hydrolase [Leptospiraceae bacterium]|nr:alpha/beta hydrolase [Leptospiraceae bacterium]
MNQKLKEWKASGEFIELAPCRHQMFVKQIGRTSALPHETLLIIHGFPESSFSFHKVIEGLQNKFERIILCDMLGYGLSDKPVEDYTYSLIEHADTVLKVWEHFGVKGGHLLCHDMGVSVASEILVRANQNLLPGWFSDGLVSVTFTNGSLYHKMAKLRIIQKLLLTRYGKFLRNLVKKPIFAKQIKKAHGNDRLSKEDIDILWELNMLKDGVRKSYLTIKYHLDRFRFEKTRWLPALAQAKLPVHLCWGDKDQIARIEMAHYLKENVCTNAKLTIMPGVGHFCQLDNPQLWLKSILHFYDESSG